MNKLTNIQDRTGAWQTWLKFLRLEQHYHNRALQAEAAADRAASCDVKCLIAGRKYDPGTYESLQDLSVAYWDCHYRYAGMKKELEQTLVRK